MHVRVVRSFVIGAMAVALAAGAAHAQEPSPSPTSSVEAPNVTIPVPPVGPYSETDYQLPLLTEENGLQQDPGTVALYEYYPYTNEYIATSYYPCEAHIWSWPPNPVDAVYNDCGRRVWLNQYPDGTGWGACVPPYIIYYPATNRRNPSAIEITGVGHCP
jgi:hypothetical protein